MSRPMAEPPEPPEPPEPLGPPDPLEPPRPPEPPQSDSVRFASWMGSMWLYTILRFGLFLVLWGLLYVAGLKGVVGAFVAVLLSVPLSYVLLARPRARFAANIEKRVNARREQQVELDARLAGVEQPSDPKAG